MHAEEWRLARNVLLARINSLIGVQSFIFLLFIRYKRDSAPRTGVIYVSREHCLIFV